MDELRKKYKLGQIDKKTYQEKLTQLTIFHLEVMNYKHIGKIADGSHGVVFEMKSPNTVLNVAVKVALEDFEHGSGLMSWSKLAHENILPLITWRVIKEANSKVFITLKCDKTLQNKIASFRCDFSGFEKAVNCTRDITNAINYLHHQGLCHLNLTPDRIFIEYNNKARLGGFGYLASKDAKKLKFGTSVVFHSPEAYRGTNRKIDGQKFDIWTLGILAIETFTGHYLSKEMSKWQAQPETWYMQLYGLLYDVLQKEKFYELVKKNFPNWKADDDKLDQALNFIQSCLMFNPEDRPSADDLLELRLIGGHVAKFWPKRGPNIWAEMVSSMDLVTLASQKRNQDTSDSDHNSSDEENNDMKGEHVNESNVIERDIKKELSIEREKVEKDFENLIQKSKHLNLVGCEPNISSKNDDNKETSDPGLEIRDAILKKDNDFCVEGNSVNTHASDYEKYANLKKEEHKENFIAPDMISDKIEIKNDIHKHNASDNIITFKFEESFNLKNSGQKNILDSKYLNDDIEAKTNEIETKENVVDSMNMSIHDNDVNEAKNGFEKIDKDLNMKEETIAIKKKAEKIAIKAYVNDDRNTPITDGKVKEEKTEIDENNKDLCTKEKTNDTKKKAIKVETKENIIDKLNNDRVVKNDIVSFDKNNKNLTLEEKANGVKQMNDEIEIRLKMIDKLNVSNIDQDRNKEKYEFNRKNQDLNVIEKTNDVKKECKKIKTKEDINDNMNMSNNDGDVKEEKSEFSKVDTDLCMKENTNDEKYKTIKVEIKENAIDDLNISNNYRDIRKYKTEFDKQNVDLNKKRKSERIKNKAKNKETQQTVFDNMSMLFNDRDVKEYKREFHEKNKDQNTKEEINYTILDKNAPNLNDTVHDQINKTYAGNNNIEPIESIQYEQNYAPILNTDADSDKNLSDNFETSKNTRQMKPHSKKRKSKNVTIVNTDEKPEQINYQTGVIKKKQYDQIVSEEHESLSSCNEIPIKYNVKTLHKWPRKSLTKAHPNDKYLQMKQYQLSYKSSTETQFDEKFNDDIKKNQKCSLNTCEKRDVPNRKQKPARKTYSSKNLVGKVEQFPATLCSDDQRSVIKAYSPKNVIEKVDRSTQTSSSERQRLVRRTYSSRSVVEKAKLLTATPSSEKIQDNENYDLEPGEIPLFNKDYDKVLDKAGTEYSVASLSDLFGSVDAEDLEEGEIDPHNPGSNYDSNPTRIRRCLKQLCSWWKQQ